MNDGFVALSSYELTEKESTTLGDETLDTLYFDASLPNSKTSKSSNLGSR